MLGGHFISGNARNDAFGINPLSPVQKIKHDLLNQMKLDLWVKRDDLIHPLISGNKWRKLKYNLNAEATGFVTCGGAFSNHIFAFAAALKLSGLNGIVFVRGEDDPLNPTLRFVRKCGVPIVFVPRDTYREAHQTAFEELRANHCPDFHWIPEGGSNEAGVLGMKEMAVELIAQLPEAEKASWHLAVATGGSIAGLISANLAEVLIQGYSVLKNYDPSEAIRLLLPSDIAANWQCDVAEAYGGYAKWTMPLLERIKYAWNQFHLPLDPVYTGKAWDMMWQKIERGEFAAGTQIVFVHTGGLQGIRGFNQRFDNCLGFLESAIPDESSMADYFKA